MPAFDEQILFSNPVAAFAAERLEIMRAIEGVCSAGPYILGHVVETFEHDFAAWNGAAHAVGVGSGTDALILAMKALGIGAGDEVVTVAHTALATVSAIAATGATAVLVDVAPGTFLIDTQKIQAAITPKTRAIIPVHLYGYACDMDAILSIADQNGLHVIEDCAQAHGAMYKNKKAGTMGVAGCFSFYPTKNLGAIGDAGAVITSNAGLAGKVSRMRQYGWDQGRVAHITGTVSRLDPVQAAILAVRLKKLDAATAKRRAIAKIYDEHIDRARFGRATPLPSTDPVYHLYVVTSDRRAAIMPELAQENILAGIHYETSAHKHPGYEPFVRVPAGGLPETERLAASVLSLPMYPELSLDDVRKIAEVLNRC